MVLAGNESPYVHVDKCLSIHLWSLGFFLILMGTCARIPANDLFDCHWSLYHFSQVRKRLPDGCWLLSGSWGLSLVTDAVFQAFIMSQTAVVLLSPMLCCWSATALKEERQMAGNTGWSRTGTDHWDYLSFRWGKIFLFLETDFWVGVLVSMILGTELSPTSILAFSGILDLSSSPLWPELDPLGCSYALSNQVTLCGHSVHIQLLVLLGSNIASVPLIF